MDITQVQDIAGWLIGIFATSIVTGIIGVISIIKAGKMLPRDLRGADLENKGKEIDIADKYELLADKAAQKVIKLQERLDNYETNQIKLKLGQDNLQRQIDTQAQTIQSQAATIEKQEAKIESQDIRIETLTCEVSNYKIYTNELISQLRNAEIAPVDMGDLDLEDCNGKTPSTRKKKK